MDAFSLRVFALVFFVSLNLQAKGSRRCVVVCVPAGQIVWRRHAHMPEPSRQTVCATCTMLLPIVERYCSLELDEDCSDLHALMERFDSEAEMESSVLGRSLLCLVRDEDDGLHSLSRRMQTVATPNPFQDVRARLATAGLAIQALHPQVHLGLDLCTPCGIYQRNTMSLQSTSCFCRA